MVSKRHKSHPDLPVPVPNFPLSSPISEEISSPSCSSEDRDLERNRPFDFLVKATKQKESKSGKGASRSPNLSRRDRHAGDNTRIPSIRGITKKKKNAAKPLGLNLITDFSLTSPKKRPQDTAAPFVDLNDLKQLSKVREKERSAQRAKDVVKKRTSRGFQRLPDENGQSSNDAVSLDPKSQNPFSDNAGHELSPSDRHVMIGLSVPRSESLDRSRDLDSTGDLNAPPTPSIIITPACEDTPWSTSSPEAQRPRATSSIYSQPTPRLWQNESDIPPVPAIPAVHSGTRTNTTDTDLLKSQNSSAAKKQRPVSTSTEFEEDSPQRQTPSDENGRTPLSPLSVNTETNRPQSQGWWTYLLSPLLKHSSPLTSKKSPTSPGFPPTSSPITPATQAPTKEWWQKEKEVSCFSPDTPETVAPTRWPDDNTNVEQSRSLGITNDEPMPAATTATNRQTTMSFMFPGRPIQGHAAEYYQACAHELFSRTPYFECFNHICSLTPANTTVINETCAAAGVPSDRGLALVEVDPPSTTQIYKSQAGLTGTGNLGTEAHGLLIDVDSPVHGTTRGTAATATRDAPSPVSDTDSEWWASPVLDQKEKASEMSEKPKPTEKSLPELPLSAKEPVSQPPSQEPAPAPSTETSEKQPPAPVPVPAPAPSPPAPHASSAPPAAPIPVAPPAHLVPPAPAPAPPEPPAQPAQPAQPAPPQIIYNIAPPANNFPYPVPPAPVPQTAVTAERAVSQYVAIFPPHQGTQQAVPAPVAPQPDPPAKLQDSAQGSESPKALPIPQQPAAHPQGPGWRQLQQAPPPATEPISPGFQHAAGGEGSMPLSEMHAPAPAYTQFPRDAPLPPRYDLHSAPRAAVMNPTGQRGPVEARRQRLEREDAVGRKIGGLWRGRGPVSKKGCFGRPGREGRLRRRWYFAIASFFLIIVILAIVLAITLTKKGAAMPVESRWLNLTGYPPMPTGVSTIAGTDTRVYKSSCIKPSSLWSCALPPDEHAHNKPYNADEPSFRVEIRFRNGTYDHSTETGSPKSARQLHARDESSVFKASPSPPSVADQKFLGNTTDSNAEPYAGEETPFYMTILSPVPLSSTKVFRRSKDNTFPNLTAIIPAPSENSDGTAAAATLYPLPESQPVRLFDRGKSTEHYGFYTYFDKSIFLESLAALNGSSGDNSPSDADGGSSKKDARTRCTWSQTRFLVQIWTQPVQLGRELVSASYGNSSSSSSSTVSATSTSASGSKSSSSATNFTRPGSFPYPITITLDRHGGSQKKKLVYCYGVEEDGHFNITNKKLQIEERGIGGTLVNPASGIFDNLGDDSSSSSSSNGSTWGGTDGGTGGCECQWTNWVSKD
ncbi:hypothetical protein NUU61_006014 [Penicillium alfredii]|uniref:Uncharacterized protein n=1 Tax=Penicillium alfredii TaxID=1506179 RepID=A0A9W9F016_9EURO|nr:uncharacterized protein NUU61_006014 [Penicillium alfredii]KAJ5091144.1 hypothetical protein NUU61_006014 [Penicillium alfredii]